MNLIYLGYKSKTLEFSKQGKIQDWQKCSLLTDFILNTSLEQVHCHQAIFSFQELCCKGIPWAVSPNGFFCRVYVIANDCHLTALVMVHHVCLESQRSSIDTWAYYPMGYFVIFRIRVLGLGNKSLT